jgi:hypothetical protein
MRATSRKLRELRVKLARSAMPPDTMAGTAAANVRGRRTSSARTALLGQHLRAAQEIDAVGQQPTKK